MDSSPHDVSGQNAPIKPPDLPEGWRYAEPGAWKDPRLASRRRVRILRVSLVALVLSCVIGFAVWNAAAHYARGVHALKIHDYSWAVAEFSAARVFVIPYRNARSLEERARRDAAAAGVLSKQADARLAAVAAQLQTAATRLKAGDADGVFATLRAISAADLQAARDGSGTVRGSADALGKDLAAASRRALHDGAWSRAGRLAAALLVLEPSSDLAVTLGAQAQTGLDLAAKLNKAKDAARQGKWRVALRTALAVLAVQKDFPGAAVVVADARRALAPKPKPAATTGGSTPPAGGGSTTTTGPPPPP